MKLLSVILVLLPFLSLAQAPQILKAKNGHVKVEEMIILNSPYRETNISITPNGRYLYYMSGRGGKEWSTKDYTTFNGKPEYDGDVWMSEKRNGNWTRPKAIGQPVNSSSGEDEPVISQDGQHVYYQSWKGSWGELGGPYYSSELDGKKWRTPKPLGGGINQMFVDSMAKYNTYATDGMSVSPNQKTFIVAAGSDYDGNLDLYVAKKHSGKWAYPVKSKISTAQDERSVFIAADGKTIYFASSGYGGKGGLDIFKAELHSDGRVDHIINLGTPFNTHHDDYGFIVAGNGYEAYFVRDGDIFHADLREADPKIRPATTLILDGVVKDQNGNPLKAKVTVQTKEGKDINNATTNRLTGEFSVSVPNGIEELVIKIENDGNVQTFDLHPGDKTALKEEFVVNSKRIDHLILFDFDKHYINDKEEEELKQFVTNLKLHPESKVYLSGHTCSHGDHDYNLWLSENRAKHVYNYLIKNGIPKSQVVVSFHGEKQPSQSNSYTSGRESNRRVELTVK